MIRYPDIASSIQVRHLQVPLEQAVTFDPDAPADAVLRELRERAFDRAPVFDGRVVGVVEAASLGGCDGSIRDLVRAVDPQQIVSADAPVSLALEWLVETPFLFVLSGRRITGFFVQADLNKQPARLYFYLLVSALEMGLASELRRWRGRDDEKLLAAMPAAVRRRVLIARDEALAKDTEIDLVDHLTFSEILRVVERIPDIRVPLGSPSQRQWKLRSGPLVDLRNAVMHPTRDLLDSSHPLGHLVRMDELLRDLLSSFPEHVHR